MNPGSHKLVPLRPAEPGEKPALVVVELHLLGDLVLALPFLNAGGERFAVHVVCRPSTAPLLAGVLPAGQVHPWNPPWEPDAGTPRGRFREIVPKLRSLRPAASVCPWPDARAGWLCRLSGAKVRTGFPMLPGNYHAMHIPWRAKNQRFGRLLELACPGGLYTLPLRRPDPLQHRIPDWEQAARALGLGFDATAPWWRVEPAVAADPARRVLALAPHTRAASKEWPEARFADTANLLLRNGRIHEARALCPPGFEPRRELWPAGTVFVRTPGFGDLAAALLECSTLLANDSFPGHLAASLDVPTVTVFGSGSPDWFHPWGPKNTALRGGSCPHHPCIERCVMPEFYCLGELTPEDAARAVVEVLESR